MLGAMPTVRPRPSGSPLGSATSFVLTALAAAVLVSITACERRRGCAGDYCGTLVFAAAGEPDILLPAVTQQQYAQDITGQLFLKLADLGLSGNTVGDEDFQPQLAQRWEWDDPLTLVFHLDPRAHWQDGRSVTAADVAFTFDIYTDPLVNSPYRSSLRTISAVTTRDSVTAVFRFHARYPEMFYDAVYHMLIVPAHLLRPVPRSQWRSAALGRAPVGDGPYRFVGWKAGVWGDLAQVPPGPLARIWSIWDPETRDLPYDTTQAARLLTRLGWRDSNGDGIRDRDGQPLAFRLLVPTTSHLRGQYARLLQEQFRRIGADVQLDEVEFSVFDQRTQAGRFDAAVIARGTDPTPSSSIAQVWTAAGRSNAGRYANPVFDRLVDEATAAPRHDAAKRLWRRAVETLNQDAPAIFLYATDNVAAVNRRVTDVVIRPDAYWALVRTWRIPADQLTDRDRAER